ncbi:MAG: hypothetical protein IJ883_01195 [Eubacterium sp.]|nr:hypothetical protein [Eubacterium sp.]
MKNKVILLTITVVAVLAMAAVMSGCSCNSKDDETTFNPKNVQAESASSDGNGNVVVNDNFGTISPTEKATDKDGNTVISYTDSQGNRVIRTVKKDGSLHIVVKNKKGKVIKEKTYKQKTPQTTKKSNNKKKDDKKNDGKEHGVVANDGDGWSDFY